MPLVVDFSAVEDMSTVAEGVYPALVFKADVLHSKAGNPYINWTFKLLGEFEGRQQWMMTSLQPKALWKLKELLAALGETEETLSGSKELDLETYLGAYCKVKIVHEEYNGQTRSKVDSVEPLNVDEQAALDTAQEGEPF